MRRESKYVKISLKQNVWTYSRLVGRLQQFTGRSCEWSVCQQASSSTCFVRTDGWTPLCHFLVWQRLEAVDVWSQFLDENKPSRFTHSTAKLFGCFLSAQVLLLQTPFWRNIQDDWCARVLPLFHLKLLCLLTLKCIYWVHLVSPRRFSEPFFVP